MDFKLAKYVWALAPLILFSCISKIKTEAIEVKPIEVKPIEVKPIEAKHIETTKSDYFIYAKVPVESASLSLDKFELKKSECYRMLVEQVLDFSPRLKAIKSHPKTRIQISETMNGNLDTTQPAQKVPHPYFLFQIQSGKKETYSGIMYVAGKESADIIKTGKVPPFTYEYKCSISQDSGFAHAVELKSANGEWIFASTCAHRMQKGEKVDERCKH